LSNSHSKYIQRLQPKDIILQVNKMTSINGSNRINPGIPKNSDLAKKKRVIFETLAKEPLPAHEALQSRLSVEASPTSSLLNSSTNQTPKSAKKKLKKGTTPDMIRTYRFDLTLKDLTNSKDKNACNEFNWLDMVAEEEDKRIRAKMEEHVKQKNLQKLTNPFMRFDPNASDDEEKIKALAKKFEDRYGSASQCIKKKKKDRKVDDYADLGYGYDTDDSFIDDSELHDELVPETVTTAHGGFYINTGLLEFKPRESAEEDSDLEAVIKAGELESKSFKKKRIKSKLPKDEESSSDDPEERQRGKVNPLFGSKKSKQ